MRFFDAHCDTITKIMEGQEGFAPDAGAAPRSGGKGDTGPGPHVTLPGLKSAGVCTQVFACWVWSEKHSGREFEVAMAEVEAVRRLCQDHPDDLFFATAGADVTRACEGDSPIAVVASLEGADPLRGEADDLKVFHEAGVRLLTLAWGDNAFCGSTYGAGTGLTARGADLVAASEENHVIVDVSHASDAAFWDVCRTATRPFVASHSNCRSLCPSPRNLTDEMIREIGKRGGVVGISLAPGFLSADFHQSERASSQEFFAAIANRTESVEEAGAKAKAATLRIPRPPLRLIVDHVTRAMNAGGEDCVGLGGDLDGIDSLPLGLDGVADYPRIADLLRDAGLTPLQVEKVCFRNFARVFGEILA